MSGYKITNTDGIILNSDGKGLSIPTVNSIANAPTNIPEGSIIYAIDNKQIYRFNGTSWLVSAGTSGTSGNTGNAGSSGTSGSTGTSGSSGNSGTDGSSGSSGSTGTSGSSGSTGSSGSSGSTGSAGTSGTSGSSGSSGTTGTSGNTGSSGSSGSSGSTGTSGSSGSSGTSGQSVPGGLSILYSGTDLSSTSFVTGRITYSLSSLGSNNGDLRISGVDGNGNTIQNGSTATLLDQLISKGATGSDGHVLTISERGNSAKINYYSYSTLTKATTPTNTDAVFTGLDYIGGSGESTFVQPVISLTMVGAAGTSGSSGSTGSSGSSGSSGTSGANGTSGSTGTSGSSGSTGSSGTSGAGTISNGTSGYVAKFTGATTLSNSLIYDNGTSVGIGNSNPTVPLDVSNNVNNGYGQLRLASSSSYGTRLTLTSTATNGKIYQLGSNFITGTGEFGIYDYDNSVLRLTISSTGAATFSGTLRSGNLGVNTAPNTYGLKVVQSTTSEWIAGFVNTGTTPYGIFVDTTANSSSQASLQLYTASGGGLIFTNDTRMGIGIFSPSSYLHIAGTNNFTQGIRFSEADGNYRHGLYFGSSGGDPAGWGLDLYTATGASTTTTNLSLRGNGRIGVGTPNPVVSFDIGAQTDAVRLPVGTTGQRPTGAAGMIRYNSSLSVYEVYDSVNSLWVPIQTSVSATGGTVTTYTSGGISYKVHSFASSGAFTVAGNGVVDYLIVGGGGAGGYDVGGGGGAGGLLQGSTTISTGSYTITVGSGGATNSSGGVQHSGGNSSGLGFTAYGGGGGGNYNSGSYNVGANGGSGGGGQGYSSGYSAGGSGTAGQGYGGGAGRADLYSSGSTGGGGGGAGGAGSEAVNNIGGYTNGGPGVASSITGTSVTYAKGGAGGGDSWGGTTAGAANTGNGGDGAGIGYPDTSGGSGIVIIRYRLY